MEQQMKILSVVTLVTAFVFAPAAFAQTTPATPANKVDCEKAKMKWDAKGGKDGKGACVAATPAKTGQTPKT
jgi:hypothetical protein